MTYFSLKQPSSFFVAEEERYYNLDTNRFVKNINGKVVHPTVNVVSENEQVLIDWSKLNNVDCDFELTPVDNPPLFDFSLSRIYVEGVVVYVVDGDTVDVEVTIPLSALTKTHYITSTVDGSVRARPYTFLKTDNPETKITIRVRCRLMGVDTAEKDTDKGKLAKRLAEEFYAETNNVVWCSFLGKGSRGRALTEFYSNYDDTTSINERLLNYADPELGKITTYYDGKTERKRVNFDNNDQEINPFLGRGGLVNYHEEETQATGWCLFC